MKLVPGDSEAVPGRVIPKHDTESKNDEDVQNIICAEKLTITEDHNNSDGRDKDDRPSQDCVS